jgi:hypothetical protein
MPATKSAIERAPLPTTAILAIAGSCVCLSGAAQAHVVAGNAASFTFDDAEAVMETAQTAVHAAVAWSAHWVGTGYQRQPAVMIGLAGVLLLPVLVLLGFVLHRRERPYHLSYDAMDAEIEPAGLPRIEIEGAWTVALPAGRDLVQIGRQDDNDICIDDESVHRYHAVIERRSGRGFVITDVSGYDGNGLRINGETCSSADLVDGDMIELGWTRMRFATAA